jgi:hypothetical protein
MHVCAERLAHMPTGRSEQAAMQYMFRHNGGMRQWLDHAASITCRGFEARCAPDGEREGQSRLASLPFGRQRVSQREARRVEPPRM